MWFGLAVLYIKGAPRESFTNSRNGLALGRTVLLGPARPQDIRASEPFGEHTWTPGPWAEAGLEAGSLCPSGPGPGKLGLLWALLTLGVLLAGLTTLSWNTSRICLCFPCHCSLSSSHQILPYLHTCSSLPPWVPLPPLWPLLFCFFHSRHTVQIGHVFPVI